MSSSSSGAPHVSKADGRARVAGEVDHLRAVMVCIAARSSRQIQHTSKGRLSLSKRRDAMSLPVVDATRAGTLCINPPRSGKKNVALVVTDLIHGSLAARLAGLALVAAASGEEHHHASHGGDENLTPGRDLSAD